MLPPLLFWGPANSQLSTVTTPTLNLTVIAAAGGESALECWQLGPFVASAVPGIAGAPSLFLGPLANATYSAIPPRSDGGWHNAPVPQ